MSNLGQETNKMNSIVSVLVAVSLSLLLTACGGGGGTAVAPEQPGTGNMGGNNGGDNGGGGTDSGDGSTAGGGSGGGGSGGGGNTGGDGGNGNGGGTTTPSNLSDADTVKGYRDDAQDAEVEVPQILYRAAVETGANLIALESDQVIASAMGVSSGITAEASSQLDAMKVGDDDNPGIAKVEEYLAEAKRVYAELDAEATRLATEGGEAAAAAATADIAANEAKTALGTAQAELDGLNTGITALEISITEANVQLNDFTSQLAVLEDILEQNRTQDNITRINELKENIATQNQIITSAQTVLDGPGGLKMERADAERAVADATAEAEAKRAEADDLITESQKVNAKQAEVAEDAEAVGGTDGTGGYIEEIDTALTKLKAAVDADIARWDTLLGNVSEQDKAEMVFSLLANDPGSGSTRNVQSPLVISTTGDLIELDTSGHVFLRAAPEGTMTVREIAEGKTNWNIGRHYFRISDQSRTLSQTQLDDTRIGLPQGHYAINFQQHEIKVSDFVVRTDGTHGMGGLPTGVSLDTFNEGSQYQYYHGKLEGIEGTLYCDLPGGCDFEVINPSSDDPAKRDVKYLGSGWRFTPVVNETRQGELGYNPAMSRYVDSDGNSVYELVDNYIDYGLWLEGNDIDPGSLTLQGRIGWVGDEDEYVPASRLQFDDSTLPSGTATYSGDAHGLSARRTGSGDDMTTASGHFEADVTLNVAFGTTPVLAGRIDNFREVAGSGHVDPAWSLSLQSTIPAVVPDARTPGVIMGTYDGSKEAPGRWGWEAYGTGSTVQRPFGFFGDFEALFYDGDANLVGAAAGLYHAECASGVCVQNR